MMIKAKSLKIIRIKACLVKPKPTFAATKARLFNSHFLFLVVKSRLNGTLPKFGYYVTHLLCVKQTVPSLIGNAYYSLTENSTLAVVNVKNDARYSRHNSHLNWSY